MRPSRSRTGTAVVGLLVSALMLAGCGAAPAEPTPTMTPTIEPEPTPVPTGPVLHPDGTAEENLPLFDQVINAVWAGPEPVSGRAYIDALTAVGFDRAAMQVTADSTPRGDAVDTLEFSVQWGDQCLIGQVGPGIGGTASVIMPLLASGTCLIGATRPIDW